MEQAFGIVEPEQQRPDEATAGFVTKTAHHTISGAQALHLEHGTRARKISKIQTLGHDTIERFVPAIQPPFGRTQFSGKGSDPKTSALTHVRRNGLEHSATVTEWSCQKRFAQLAEQTVERHESGGRIRGKASNAALRGVKSHL